MLFASELFSVPALSIHPPEVFEGEHFNITCQIDIFASVRIQREDIKYFIFKEKTPVISNYRYSNTASNVTNGKYMCVAKANDIIKESSSVLFRAKGRQSLVINSLGTHNKNLINIKQVKIC